MITCEHPISSQKQKGYSLSPALRSRSVSCTLHTDVTVDSNIANCMLMCVCVCLTYLTARVAGDQKGGLLTVRVNIINLGLMECRIKDKYI